MVMLVSGGWGKFRKGFPTFVLQLSLLTAVGLLLGVLSIWFLNCDRHASERKRLTESEDVKFCRALGEISQRGYVSSSERELADV